MANIPNPTPPATDALKDLISQWRKTVETELKGVPFEKKLVTKTPEGVALQPLYTRADLASVSHLESRPGEAPFLRGTRPFGYKTHLWETCQELSAKDASDFNAKLLKDLMGGQNSVVLTPDCISRSGKDIDQAAGPCGCGFNLSDSKDFEVALAGVDLAAVPVHMATGADALPLGTLLLASLAAKGADARKLAGSVTADPIGALAETGELPGGVDAAVEALAAWTRFAAKSAPGLRTVGVEAGLWLEAGGSATQELALAVATGAAYLKELQARGLEPAEVAARMRVSFAVGTQFFTEVAKFRAFRLLWSRVLAAYGCPDAAARTAVHARTADFDKTLHDAHVNLLRATTEALSAVLGGVDSLHIAPFDEVSGSSDEFSRRIARNIHTLLAEEFNFTETADPAGGSWYVEKLTDELARKAWTLFQELEGKGGIIAALRSGAAQKLVTATAAERFDGVAKRRTGIIGTNLFPNLKEKVLVKSAPDAARHAALAAALKARRPAAVATLAKMDPKSFVAAASKGATVGQLARASLAGLDGVERVESVATRRLAEGFETLRAASEQYAKATGARPKVFLAKMGPVLQHKARADFSAGFFAVGGFEPIAKQTFETAEQAADAAAKSGAPVAVLCSTDDTYPTLAPAFAQALKAAKPDVVVVLAGQPADKALAEQFKAAGFDEFIHIRANVAEILANLLKKIGALK